MSIENIPEVRYSRYPKKHDGIVWTLVPVQIDFRTSTKSLKETLGLLEDEIAEVGNKDIVGVDLEYLKSFRYLISELINYRKILDDISCSIDEYRGK